MKPLLTTLFLVGLCLVVPHSMLAAPIVAGSFSTTWDGGDSSVIQINLGACPAAVYWEEIDNESNNGTSTVCIANTQTITFPYAGRYRVDFSGNFTLINLIDQNQKDKFRSVEQWGDSAWITFDQSFSNVTDLTFNATDIPTISNGAGMSRMFDGATNFNSDISQWDVSNVGGFDQTFRNAAAFNQPLDSWNMSNAYSMEGMFDGASSFNQPLGGWDVSGVHTMERMFAGATSFNQSLNSWNVTDLIFVAEMFTGATSFNQPLGDWNIGEPCPLLGFHIWQWFFPVAYACVGNNFAMDDMFLNSGMDSENYTATLQGWATLPTIPININLGSVSTTYCDTAQSARDILTGNGWTITDLGSVPCVVEESESSGGSSGTKVGIRSERIEALRTAVEASSSTAMVGSVTSFVSSLKNILRYLTENEEEIETLSPAEAKQLIVVLRDVVLQLLRLLPGI